jgi:hypothetical protein
MSIEALNCGSALARDGCLRPGPSRASPLPQEQGRCLDHVAGYATTDAHSRASRAAGLFGGEVDRHVLNFLDGEQTLDQRGRAALPTHCTHHINIKGAPLLTYLHLKPRRLVEVLTSEHPRKPQISPRTCHEKSRQRNSSRLEENAFSIRCLCRRQSRLCLLELRSCSHFRQAIPHERETSANTLCRLAKTQTRCRRSQAQQDSRCES